MNDKPSAADRSLATFLLAILALVVAGGGYAIWRFVENALAAVERRFGDWLYVIGAVITFAALMAVIVGLAAVLLRWLWQRSGQVYPNAQGMYPAVRSGKRAPTYQTLNEPGAQSLAAVAAHQRPTAALGQRVIEANYGGGKQPALLAAPEPEPVAPEIDYGAPLPRTVSLYTAPLPRQLSLPVGVDPTGRQVAIPLRNLGNVLIGGNPGGGKSELLADFVAGLARQDATGQRVQIAVCDMKLVSFGNMSPDLPILRWPVAVDVDPALALIEQVLEEVRRRYEILMAAQVRSLDSYVQKTGEALPHLVTIIDEIADLSARRVSRASFTEVASEIARKGRAAGVTMIMATQRPSTEVLPAELRNLEGVAIAFSVDRWEDSKLILGRKGAELLPSIPGRCLVRAERTVVAQAYLAGLDETGGHSPFDTFLASLPRTLQPRQPVVELAPPTGPQPAPNQRQPAVEPVVQRLEPGRQPDAATAATMRQLYQSGWSLNRICNQFYGYKDGTVFEFVKQAVGYTTGQHRSKPSTVVLRR